MPPDTLKDMPSHDKAVIDQVIAMSKFKHANSLVASNFFELLADHIKEKGITRVRELCHLLFEFSIQCAVQYDRPEDFIDKVEFSRKGISDLLSSSSDSSFSEVLTALRGLSDSIEQDLMKPPVASLE